VGLDCHIGSQLTDLAPVAEALQRVTRLFAELRRDGLPLRYLDVGGGLGITYHEEVPPPPDDYAQVVRDATAGLPDVTLILEPGRVLVGNAGVLLTRVVARKQQGRRQFAIVDAGMNDLIRPALYGAHHAISAVRPRRGPAQRVEVVGPVCESTDVLGQRRDLPPLRSGVDLLAIHSAGAYGMAMASNYNSRPRPAEVLVDGKQAWCIRARETRADLVRHERVPAALRTRRGRLSP
jgi:diaminopimelate decarboxylase